jgi:hypothetical protein
MGSTLIPLLFCFYYFIDAYLKDVRDASKYLFLLLNSYLTICITTLPMLEYTRTQG